MIVEGISWDNAVHLYLYGIKYMANKLTSFSLASIIHNFTKIYLSEDFQLLSDKQVEKIFHIKFPNVSDDKRKEIREQLNKIANDTKEADEKLEDIEKYLNSLEPKSQHFMNLQKDL